MEAHLSTNNVSRDQLGIRKIVPESLSGVDGEGHTRSLNVSITAESKFISSATNNYCATGRWGSEQTGECQYITSRLTALTSTE